MRVTISLIIPWRSDGGRRDHLLAHVLGWWEWWRASTGHQLEIVLGSNDEEPFNRSAARNEAFSRSTGDVLVVADADTIPSRGGVRAAVAVATSSRRFQWALPYAEGRYYNLSEAATDRILATTPVDIPEPTDPSDWEHKITSWAGCYAMRRSAWETIGGYDERFVGWGGEDNAFQMAADTLVGPHARVAGHICHLWHERGSADFTQPQWPENSALLRRYRSASGNRTRMKEVSP